MAESTRRTLGVQRGPRSARVVDQVRAATMVELARVGFASLTVGAVAQAANVNRTTIYRRWPSKAALLAAVVEPLLEHYGTTPDTGSAHGDLLALIRTARDTAALPEGRALAEAVKTSSHELDALVGTTLDRALAPFRAVLDRAVARGELDPSDRDAIAHLAFYGVVMWEQTHGGPASDEDCERLARILVRPAG